MHKHRLFEILNKFKKNKLNKFSGSLVSLNKYNDYVNHQKEKTLDPERIKKLLGEDWDIKVEGFKKIFKRNIKYVSGKKNAICLGSRTGQEVKALIDMGVTAVGIDLVPFPPYTIEGDIHDIKYADQEFDLVFTNIFDHSLYPDKLCSEIERITKPNAIIILNLIVGIKPDNYAENTVNNPQKVTELFKKVKIKESKEINNIFDSLNWELVLEKLK